MKDMDNDHSKFIDCVWRKVRHLEYKRSEEELLYKRQRSLYSVRIRNAIIFLITLVLVSLFFFFIVRINMFTLMLLGTIYMGIGLIYESFSHITFNGR